MKPVDSLIGLLSQDKVIPVIGAGVSFAAAGLLNWKGTIEDGLKYAEERTLDPTGANIQNAEDYLAKGQLIQAANIMKDLLNAPDHPFADWLESLFGNPRVRSKELLNSIHDLCTPIILTTNYDDLLYSTDKSRAKKVFDWSEHQEIARALNKKKELILHIHGFFEKPETIILSADDYKLLAGQLGYKAILHQLWTEYHFLFIGSSRDGVMDEDFSTVFNFLNQWFPGVPHQHFILMQETDIKKGLHIDLLKKSNVEAINYGTSYDALPAFINSINPNRKKAAKRIQELKREIEDEFNRQILPAGSLVTQPSVINDFLRDNLPNKIYWIDSVQLSILEDLLRKYNEGISSYKEKFANYLAIIKGLVSISELDEKIELWNKNWDNPSALNTSSFINLAILSYECLNRFPKDLLEEIRHRENYAIHDYYFDGYLGRFINEFRLFKENDLIDTNQFYNNDKYFFENLKRIIKSLYYLLQLNPEEIFPELPPAKITPDVKAPFLLFVAEDGIALRNFDPPYEDFAWLPAEKKLPVRNATIVTINGKPVIIGYTSQKCFYWNPVENLSAVHFFKAPVNKTVRQVFCIEKENEVITYIYSGRDLITYKNFKEDTVCSLPGYLEELVYDPSSNSFWGLIDPTARYTGPVLYHIQLDGTCVPILSSVDVWNLAKDIIVFKERLNEELIKQHITEDIQHLFYPFIFNAKIKLAKWRGENTLIIRVKIQLITKLFTFLAGFTITEGRLSNIFRMGIPGKLCLAFDTIEKNGSTDLLCGYLATGDYPAHLVQYFEQIDQNDIFVADDQHSIVETGQLLPYDILEIKAITENRAIAIQYGQNKIYDIKLPGLTYSTATFDKLINIIPYFNQP